MIRADLSQIRTINRWDQTSKRSVDRTFDQNIASHYAATNSGNVASG